MYLTKNGVTVDVSHPSDIKRYLALGYVEEVIEVAPESKAEPKPKRSKSEPKADADQKGDEA